MDYDTHTIFAIDPGVNFGMTIVQDGAVWMFHGSLKKADLSAEYAWNAFNFLHNMLVTVPSPYEIIIEGAAYHKVFGQVGLADVRTGFYLGARSLVSQTGITIVAPMSARKAVLGEGKAKPWELWPTTNHNAIDSLVLAAYGMGTSLRV